MIPYIHVDDGHIGPVPLHPFGILVATGVLVGTTLATRRARDLGYDQVRLNSFVTWMLVAGFIGGHVLDQLFYHWDEVVKRPISIIILWEGLSSFGGFTGAFIGIVLWKFLEVRKRGFFYTVHLRPTAQSILPLADLILAVFPFGWMFGRAGCATVHDHPGALAPPGDTLLAVAYPSRDPVVTSSPDAATIKLGFIQIVQGHHPRFDLGMLELLFTVALAVLFALTWRRKVPVGSYVIASALAYAPVRLVMDFLRIPETERGDTRYAGLTPAQWCTIALFVYGLAMAVYVRSLKKRGIDLGATARAAATG
jgi:phosphatidylglycerol---prolipoprotein diacylglyceryl transferase